MQGGLKTDAKADGLAAKAHRAQSQGQCPGREGTRHFDVADIVERVSALHCSKPTFKHGLCYGHLFFKMAEGICGLCAKAVEPDDFYRELVCSRKCEGNVFHELCVERFLRRHGHGSDQKTGFDCPRTQSNGKPCPGTVKRTHVKFPTNTKKKEQNRQAAVEVNSIVNASRAVAVPVQASKVEVPVTKENQKAITKVAKVTVVKRASNPGVIAQHLKPTGRRPFVYGGEGEETADADDFSNFLPIGKRASKRNEDKSEWENSASQPAIQPYNSDKRFRNRAPRLQKQSTDYGIAASAVSNNSAMAPEPVATQRIIPGWTDTTKTAAGISNLQQQRTLVAELRAKEKMPTANRAGVATLAGERKGRTESGRDEVAKSQLQERSQKKASDLFAGLYGASGDMLATCDQGLIPSLHDLAAASAAISDMGVLFEIAPSTPAAGEPKQQPLCRSFSGSGVSADTTMLNSPISAQLPSKLQDADPIVGYVQLFSLDDGALIVMDKQRGFFLHLEHVYGPDPEMIGFQDEVGNVTYYVVIRASVHKAQQEASVATTAADSSCLDGSGKATDWLSATHCALGPSAQENKAPAAMVNPGLDATRRGHIFSGETVGAMPGAVQKVMDQDDEDELNDLLALCLA
ncbi:hypothetical protein VaNZ11_002896 [Volvox africanus]|uniref:RING-type domain-containing protein n=1 Tax=Volvox africanus TaxID=51714 RepID=A0ABQ5RSV3_9CHLO|nr:hypothetical protein VaNZ11_002896 [Volvox africanus]